MRSKGARLYYDKKRRGWTIRDGTIFKRTGYGLGERAKAEESLADYIASKYRPVPTASPILADCFHEYLLYRPQQKHCLSNLSKFWKAKRVSEVNPATCQAFLSGRRKSAGRNDLQCLKACINYYHKHIHALPRVPQIDIPAAAEPKERWLSRSEVAGILREIKHPHLRRFLIIGYYSGSRSGAILNAKWDWVDLERGIMRRRGFDEPEKRNKRRPKFKVSSRLMAHLKRWRKMDGDKNTHIISYAGRPVKRIKQGWNEACKRAGVKEASPHVLRHTRVSELLKRGVSVWEVASSVGMSVAMIEQVYGHLMPGWQEDSAAD